MEKELSLLCKSKNGEKFLNLKVLKTIGKKKIFLGENFPEKQQLWRLFSNGMKFLRNS